MRPRSRRCAFARAAPDDHRLAQGVAGTLRTQFPQVLTWQALRFNQFVVGLTAPLSRAHIRARLASAPHDLLPDTALFARDFREASPAAIPWTDDRCPVEWVTDRMIAAYALRGQATAEDLLPTAPTTP
jgi:hypothetical protein